MVKTEDKGKRTGVHLNFFFFLQCTPRMKYIVLLLVQNNTFLRLGVQNILNCQKWCCGIGQTSNQGPGFQWHLHGALRLFKFFCSTGSAATPGLCLFCFFLKRYASLC